MQLAYSPRDWFGVIERLVLQSYLTAACVYVVVLSYLLVDC